MHFKHSRFCFCFCIRIDYCGWIAPSSWCGAWWDAWVRWGRLSRGQWPRCALGRILWQGEWGQVLWVSLWRHMLGWSWHDTLHQRQCKNSEPILFIFKTTMNFNTELHKVPLIWIFFFLTTISLFYVLGDCNRHRWQELPSHMQVGQRPHQACTSSQLSPTTVP